MKPREPPNVAELMASVKGKIPVDPAQPVCPEVEPAHAPAGPEQHQQRIAEEAIAARSQAVNRTTLVDAQEWLDRHPGWNDALPEEAHAPSCGKHGDKSYTVPVQIGTKVARIEVLAAHKGFRVNVPKGCVKPQISWGDNPHAAWDAAKQKATSDKLF